jgi:hypothetical protein
LDFIHLQKDVVMASDEEEEEEPARVSTTEILKQARDLARTAEVNLTFLASVIMLSIPVVTVKRSDESP